MQKDKEGRTMQKDKEERTVQSDAEAETQPEAEGVVC
jgi:hypothetical protein